MNIHDQMTILLDNYEDHILFCESLNGINLIGILPSIQVKRKVIHWAVFLHPQKLLPAPFQIFFYLPDWAIRNVRGATNLECNFTF